MARPQAAQRRSEEGHAGKVASTREIAASRLLQDALARLPSFHAAWFATFARCVGSLDIPGLNGWLAVVFADTENRVPPSGTEEDSPALQRWVIVLQGRQKGLSTNLDELHLTQLLPCQAACGKILQHLPDSQIGTRPYITSINPRSNSASNLYDKKLVKRGR